jgi:O-antigen/teichoic acid export membrane protein
MPWFAVISTGAAAAMNLAMNAALIPRFGIEGAAAASSITYALLLCVSGVYMVLRGRPRQASRESDGRTH